MSVVRITVPYDAESIVVSKVALVQNHRSVPITDTGELPVKGMFAVEVQCPTEDGYSRMLAIFDVRMCWPKLKMAVIGNVKHKRNAGTPYWNGNNKTTRGAHIPAGALEELAFEAGVSEHQLLVEDETIRRVVRATRKAFNYRRGRA